MRRRLCTPWRALVPALAVLLSCGAQAIAADATGTWTWTVQRGDNTMEQTLKLKQDGEKLTGTISGRQGSEIEIEDGKAEGETITFKVVREFNGNRFVQEYEGKVSEDEIKGEVKFERGGEPQTRPWEAKKSKD